MTQKSKRKRFTGVIISDKMNKTRVVAVEKVKTHPLYLKRFRVTKKYKAHDEKNEYKLGDKVVIEECRPISKDKHFKIIKRI